MFLSVQRKFVLIFKKSLENDKRSESLYINLNT